MVGRKPSVHITLIGRKLRVEGLGGEDAVESLTVVLVTKSRRAGRARGLSEGLRPIQETMDTLKKRKNPRRTVLWVPIGVLVSVTLIQVSTEMPRLDVGTIIRDTLNNVSRYHMGQRVTVRQLQGVRKIHTRDVDGIDSGRGHDTTTSATRLVPVRSSQVGNMCLPH